MNFRAETAHYTPRRMRMGRVAALSLIAALATVDTGAAQNVGTVTGTVTQA